MTKFTIHFLIETFFTRINYFIIFILIKICFQKITVLTSFFKLLQSLQIEVPLSLSQIKHFKYLVKKH